MKVVESEEVLMPLRYIKDQEELFCMRRAAEAADKGIEAAIKAVRPGVTEIEVAAEAEYAMRKAGSMRLGATTFIDSGPHSLYLHGGASRRKLEEGDLVVIDVHPIVDMYASDCARTVVCGQPSPKQLELISAYESAQRHVIESLSPGWTIGQITDSFLGVFSKAGLGDIWIQGPVHGVGLEFEEWPHPSHYPAHKQLVVGMDWTLAIGHSILPLRGVGGVKIEDTVKVTSNGSESLNKAPNLTQ